MRFIVRQPGKIGLVGRDQGQAETIREGDEIGLDQALVIEPMALDLDIQSRAEDIGQALEPAFGQVAKICSRAHGRSARRDRRSAR